MPVWLSSLFSALSQPVLSFFHLCQTKKSPALFVDFELCDAVVVRCFCGFCFDFFLWVSCMVVVAGCFCGGEVGCCHGSGVGCCRGSVGMRWWGFTVMVGVAAVRWVVVDNTYTTVYIHTLLLIYATYWYCFSLMCLLVLHTHICMHACSHFCSPEHGAHTRTQ